MSNKYDKISSLWFSIFMLLVSLTTISGIATVITILLVATNAITQGPLVSCAVAFIGSLILATLAYSNTQHYERLANKESKKG